MWKSFIKDIVQDQYFKEPMLHQRLPSFKIIPAGASCKYSDICIQNGIEYSAHRDGDHPYHHPSWEVNFWMPLTKIEKSNAMIVEGDDGMFYPKVINHGEVQVFFGNNKISISSAFSLISSASNPFAKNLPSRSCFSCQRASETPPN